MLQLLSIFLIALSLAMDAMAVSISVGLACKGSAAKQGLRLGLWFGAFQFAMPLVGFILGQALSAWVELAAPYIAFALLAFIGGRMLWDAFQPPEADQDEDLSQLSTGKVCLLAVATSIDALAVGVGASLMGMPLLLSCAIIGVTAFALSFLGAVVGRLLGQRFNTWAQAAGGLVLIGIGFKFLLERLLG